MEGFMRKTTSSSQSSSSIPTGASDPCASSSSSSTRAPLAASPLGAAGSSSGSLRSRPSSSTNAASQLPPRQGPTSPPTSPMSDEDRSLFKLLFARNLSISNVMEKPDIKIKWGAKFNLKSELEKIATEFALAQIQSDTNTRSAYDLIEKLGIKAPRHIDQLLIADMDRFLKQEGYVKMDQVLEGAEELIRNKKAFTCPSPDNPKEPVFPKCQFIETSPGSQLYFVKPDVAKFLSKMQYFSIHSFSATVEYLHPDLLKDKNMQFFYRDPQLMKKPQKLIAYLIHQKFEAEQKQSTSI
jgi:hypothetical protein